MSNKTLSHRVFFRTDTNVGFYVALFEQFIVTYIYTYWFFVFILFYIELCSYVDTLMSDIAHLVSECNTTLMSDGTRVMLKRDEPQSNAKIGSILKELIELHIDMIK